MDKDNQYGVLELQVKLKRLLKIFHAFCVDNNIKYSLDWGSLLGAIRHKGFIPWDDDLDIMVDRSNYNKLLKCIKDDTQLRLNDTSPYSYWIGRIRFLKNEGENVYLPTIDVIVMDNAPDGHFARKWRLVLIKLLQGTLKVNFKFNKFKRGSIFMRIVAMLTYYAGKPFSHATKMQWYNRLAQLSNETNTKEITSYYEEYSCLGKYYPKNLMDEVILVPFEDLEVYVVKDFHNCLITQFGPNYMTPIKTGLNHTEKRLKKKK